MRKEEYLELVKKHTPKENTAMNAFNAFIMGGTLGFIGEAIKLFLVSYFQITTKAAVNWVLLIFILVASVLTAFGVFDKISGIFKAGLLIPITGFANAVTSAALDYRTDGMITGLGSYFFKLSGSVLLFGIVSAFVMAIIKVILYV